MFASTTTRNLTPRWRLVLAEPLTRSRRQVAGHRLNAGVTLLVEDLFGEVDCFHVPPSRLPEHLAAVDLRMLVHQCSQVGGPSNVNFDPMVQQML
jgi:hypothetical protein